MRDNPNSISGSQHTDDIETTTTIAGLIKTMWSCLGRLWLDHLQTVHEQNKTKQSPVTLSSLKNRVRLIHALKPETLPIHHHYFHDDVENILHNATIQSLQTYIQHYLPIIMKSIQRRHEEIVELTTIERILLAVPQRVPAGLLSALEGPQSTTQDTTLHDIPHGDHSTSNDPVYNLSHPLHDTTHPAQEETPHRKHRRRRILRMMRQALLALWHRPQTSSPND